MFYNYPQSIDYSSVTLVVLAGGNGNRMGLPKAWLQLEGKPILRWLLERLHWAGSTMLVTAPATIHPPAHELFDREVVDPVDGLGPLQGILSALKNLSTPMMVVVTVDMPGIVPSTLSWLVESLSGGPLYNGVMCSIKTGVSEQIEPFPSAFRASAIESVAARLEAGRRSVQGLCSDDTFSTLDAPGDWPSSIWINLNNPNDLAKFEATLGVRNAEKKE